MNSIQAIVLAAGQGSRFNTGISKLITPVCGQPMIVYPLKTITAAVSSITVIVGFQKEAVQQCIINASLPSITFVEQQEQLGTGHAVLCSRPYWHADHLLIINGDMPLITDDIIQKLCLLHNSQQAAISFVIAHHVEATSAYGRVVQKDGSIQIVEKKHFTENVATHPYINAGIYLINRTFLERYLPTLKQHSTHEFYITDLVEVANKNSLPVALLDAPYDTIRGVNTLQELAAVEQIMCMQRIHYWMERGVRFILPHTSYIEHTVTIGKATVIGAGAQLMGTTHIGEFCTIDPYTILHNQVVHNNAHVTRAGQQLKQTSIIA
jgi:bifunctional UDP-N-acetylglucosamine pyrophosphorylase/glucosamine-1-phosphate N-acetyltransferase